MITEKYTNEIYLADLKRKCVERGDEVKGCKAFIQALPESEKQRLQKMAHETKFHRRKYGERQFYCWAHHAVLNNAPTDPWPAMHFPKAVLMSLFAIHTPTPT